jgi:hypothetical protein
MKALRQLAKELLNYEEIQLNKAINAGALVEVKIDDE